MCLALCDGLHKSTVTFNFPELPTPPPASPIPLRLRPTAGLLLSSNGDDGNDGFDAVDSALLLIVALLNFILMSTVICEWTGDTLAAWVKKLMRALSKRN